MDSLEDACLDLLAPQPSEYDDYCSSSSSPSPGSVGKYLGTNESSQFVEREQSPMDMGLSFAVRPHPRNTNSGTTHNINNTNNNNNSSITNNSNLASVDLAKEPLWYLSLISHNPTLMEAVSHLYVQLWTQYAEQRKNNEVMISALRAEQEAQLASLLEVAHAANDVVIRSDVTKRLVLRHEHEVEELMDRLNEELRCVETDAQQSFCALLKVSAPDALQVASKQLSTSSSSSLSSGLVAIDSTEASSSPLSSMKAKDAGIRVSAHEKRVKRLEYLRSLCTPRKLSRTNNMSLFADPQFPPAIYEISVQNPLKDRIAGARAKDPALAPIALEVAPLWELRRCLHFGVGHGIVSNALENDGIEKGNHENESTVESEFDTYMNDFCFDSGSQEASRNYWKGDRSSLGSAPQPEDSRVASTHLTAGLWNSRSTKQMNATEKRKTQADRDADVAADLTATAVQIHLLRLAHSHHSMLLVIGSEATANSMIEAPDAPEILMSDNWERNWTDVGTNTNETSFRPLDSQSHLKVCFTTKLWGANIILLYDPFQEKQRMTNAGLTQTSSSSSSSSSIRLPEGVVHDAFRFALPWGVDSFSLAVLPRPTDAMSVAQNISVQLLEQLQLAVASTLVDTAGGTTVSRSHLWDLNYAALLTHNNIPSVSTHGDGSAQPHGVRRGGGGTAQNKHTSGGLPRGDERRSSSYFDGSAAAHEPVLDEHGRYGGYMGRLGKPLTSLLHRVNGTTSSARNANSTDGPSLGATGSTAEINTQGSAIGISSSTQNKHQQAASPLAVNTGTIEFEGVGVGTTLTHPREMHNTEKMQFNLPMSIRAYLPLQFPPPQVTERQRVSSLSDIATLQDDQSVLSTRNASNRVSAKEDMRGAFPSTNTLDGDTPRDRTRSHRHVRMHSIIAIPTISDVLSKAFGSNAVMINN